MSNLEEFYASVDSDAAQVIDRLGGMPALVVRFLTKFKNDGSFNELCAALDSGDTETAFRAAHTLKGVCATLGIQSVFRQASAITELLRGDALNEARAAMPALRQVYEQAIDALNKLTA